MSLANYTDLQTAFGQFLARDDLTTFFPTFVALFEAHANRSLRVSQMQATSTLTPSSGSATLPADYITWRRVTWAGSQAAALRYVTPDVLNQKPALTDTPSIFTIEGSTLKVYPSDDTDITLGYYQKIPALTADAPTNWLMTGYPDAYLYGTLLQAYIFTRDSEAGSAYVALRDGALSEISLSSAMSSGPLVVQPSGPVV